MNSDVISEGANVDFLRKRVCFALASSQRLSSNYKCYALLHGC
jgi:hypothetical protein